MYEHSKYASRDIVLEFSTVKLLIECVFVPLSGK